MDHSDPFRKLYIEDGRGSYPLIEKILGYVCGGSGSCGSGSCGSGSCGSGSCGSGGRTKGLGVPERFVFLKTKKFFWEDLEYLCRIGDLEILRGIWEDTGILPNKSFVNRAAEYGKTQLLEWLALHGRLPSYVSIGPRTTLETLDWLQYHGLYVTVSEADHATEFGRIDILDWLKARGIYATIIGSNDAAKHGKIEVLEWLVSNYLPLPSIEGANQTESVKVLEWLEKHNIFPNRSGADHAACSGKIDILDWLEARGILPSDSCLPMVTSLSVFRWLKSRGLYPTEESMIKAITNDKLDILQWWVEEGHEPQRTWMVQALRSGKLKIIKWLMDFHGFVLPEVSMMNWDVFYPSFEGLESFKWISSRTKIIPDGNYYNISLEFIKLLPQDFPVQYGLKFETLDCFRWFEEIHRAIVPYFIDWSDPQTVRYALSHGYGHPTQNDITNLVDFGNLMALRALSEYGVLPDFTAYSHAASYGYTDIVQWLREQKVPMR